MLGDGELKTLIDAASELALCFARSRQGLSAQEKTSGQFASEADDEIEKTIRAGLMESTSGDVAIIGEELGGKLDETTSGWAINPIDGTSNFLRGLPLWGVSIGYLHHGQSHLGAISLPELGITLTARRGQGVKINGMTLSSRTNASSVKLIALGENDFETGRETDARAQHFRDQGYSVVRYRCAVFALANVALGRLDGYVEHGCALWDIAAAWIICSEAGVDIDVREIAPGRYSVEARWP